MSRTLFVGNIPYAFDTEALGTLFVDFGPVKSVKILMDHGSGRSKGCGFVELETLEACIVMDEVLEKYTTERIDIMV